MIIIITLPFVWKTFIILHHWYLDHSIKATIYNFTYLDAQLDTFDESRENKLQCLQVIWLFCRQNTVNIL